MAHRDANAHRLATGEELGRPVREVRLDMNPEGPIPLLIVDDQDHGISLREPELEVAPGDLPRDRSTVGELRQPIGRLDLDVDRARLEFTGMAIGRHGEVISIVVLDAVGGESAP